MPTPKLSQKDVIERHLAIMWTRWKQGLNETPFVPSFDLRGSALVIELSGATGWSGHQGDRRARELAEAGRIFRKKREDGIMAYAFADPEAEPRQQRLI